MWCRLLDLSVVGENLIKLKQEAVHVLSFAERGIFLGQHYLLKLEEQSCQRNSFIMQSLHQHPQNTEQQKNEKFKSDWLSKKFDNIKWIHVLCSCQKTYSGYKDRKTQILLRNLIVQPHCSKWHSSLEVDKASVILLLQ